MNDAIIHRGPDEDGFYSHSDNLASIGMAMRRLSIIDLSSGQQPMYSKFPIPMDLNTRAQIVATA